MKKPAAILTNIVLCCFGLIPGMIHAFIVVGQANADKRTGKIVKAINKQTQTNAEIAQAQQTKLDQ